MTIPNTPNTLSRRNWLRDAAIAATSVAVVPSMLISCTDHRIPPVGGTQDTPLTPEQLKAAAQNLLNMEAWMSDLYKYTGTYEDVVFHLLKSGEKPSDWKDFLLSILTDIAVGIIGAALAANPVLAAGIEAVVAIASANISQWALGNNKPNNLEAVFAEFEKAHSQMQLAISTMLLTLADETDNYRNLREGWKGELDFNGKKYTLLDLANAQFPTREKGTAYAALREAAYKQFQKYVWNVMIIKAGNIVYHHWGNVTPYDLGQQGGCVRSWGLNRFYSNEPYAGGYLRGYYREGPFVGYSMEYWLMDFDGRELSTAAAQELFIDDTPGHIMNPDDKGNPKTGLFPRDYVFKQFRTEKPDFYGYFDLAKEGVAACDESKAFDESTYNYEFTGGYFPQLIKK